MVIGPSRSRKHPEPLGHPLQAGTVESLRRYREQQVEEREAAGYTWKEHGLVFTTINGEPIDRRHFIKRNSRSALPASP